MVADPDAGTDVGPAADDAGATDAPHRRRPGPDARPGSPGRSARIGHVGRLTTVASVPLPVARPAPGAESSCGIDLLRPAERSHRCRRLCPPCYSQGRGCGLPHTVTRGPPGRNTNGISGRVASVSTDKPTIAFVVATLNEERAIEACLRSLLDQHYPADLIEVAVVDGGSTDRTREIMSAIAAADPRVRLLHNPGRIAACAFNIGVRETTGSLVSLVGAHGTTHPEYAAVLADAFATSGADLVGGRSEAAAGARRLADGRGDRARRVVAVRHRLRSVPLQHDAGLGGHRLSGRLPARALRPDRRLRRVAGAQPGRRAAPPGPARRLPDVVRPPAALDLPPPRQPAPVVEPVLPVRVVARGHRAQAQEGGLDPLPRPGRAGGRARRRAGRRGHGAPASRARRSAVRRPGAGLGHPAGARRVARAGGPPGVAIRMPGVVACLHLANGVGFWSGAAHLLFRRRRPTGGPR